MTISTLSYNVSNSIANLMQVFEFEPRLNLNFDFPNGVPVSDATQQRLMDLYSKGVSLRGLSAMTSLPREKIRLLLHGSGIRMRHTLAVYHKPLMEIDYDAALLLGLHSGDGHLSDAWGITVGGRDRMMGDQIVRLARRLLGVEPGISYRKDGCFIVRSAKSQVFDFFERYGFVRGRQQLWSFHH
jgi:hypothetical protein